MNTFNFGISILSFDHPEITRRCIESVRSLAPDQKIFLTHNGSRQKFTDQLIQDYPALHHLVLPANLGYSGGANAALRHVFTREKHVLFLTNDTLLEQVALPADVDLGAVRIFKRQTMQIDSVMGVVDPVMGKLRHLRREEEFLSTMKTYVPGSAFWISRDLFRRTGGFDESFHTYWEDVDLSWRARAMGYRLTYDAATVVRHSIGKTCHKNPRYTYYLYQRNRKKFMQKHGLTSMTFWVLFLYEIFKLSKSRWAFFWRIVYE